MIKILFIIILTSFLSAETKKFILITSLYNEVHPQRQAEYLECLERNLSERAIEKIHVFYDDSRDNEGINTILPFLQNRKIDISYIHKRPTFSNIFNFVNANYSGKNIIISNADIFFDESLNELNDFDLKNKMIALTRWNVQSNGELEAHPWHWRKSYPAEYAQDAWIFQSPIKNFDKSKTELGTAYCDGHIAYLAYKAGYLIFNPCLSLVTHHLHTSNLRHWILTPQNRHILGLPFCSLEKITYGSNDYIMKPDKHHKKKKR